MPPLRRRGDQIRKEWSRMRRGGAPEGGTSSPVGRSAVGRL